MGLVLVCPQCQAKVLLQSLSCPYCQADLRHVPRDFRRYVLGQPGPATAPSAAAPSAASGTEPVPPAEAAKPEVKIRRPHVRRYAAPPVAVTHPVSGKKAAPTAAESKPEAKKAKKAPAGKKKK
jgi:hypothetical protein